jgi:death-on-curing protein
VLVRNHPFVDGNKRSALLCARAFLFLNGHAFEPSEADEVEMLVALATGRANEEMAAEWFRRGSTPAKASPVKASPAKRLKAPPKKRKQPPRPTPRAARRT